MKKINLFLLLLFTHGAFAQVKYFEGRITYHVTIRSVNEFVTDEYAQRLLGAGDQLTMTFKEGNYTGHSAFMDTYTIGKDRRTYYKFRKLDTLYYIAFASDTTTVVNIAKDSGVLMVNKYPCRSIVIKTENASIRYFYSTLFADPTYDRENTIGQFNVYSRETGGAIHLWSRAEYSFASQTDSCIRVEQKRVSDHVFDLPVLPVKKLVLAELISGAHYPGGGDGFMEFMHGRISDSVAALYIKLPEGQTGGNIEAVVQFFVNEDGTLSDLQMVNQEQTGPAFAEEIMRVMKEGPRWVPAMVYGEKVRTLVRLPMVFVIKGV